MCAFLRASLPNAPPICNIALPDRARRAVIGRSDALNEIGRSKRSQLKPVRWRAAAAFATAPNRNRPRVKTRSKAEPSPFRRSTWNVSCVALETRSPHLSLSPPPRSASKSRPIPGSLSRPRKTILAHNLGMVAT